MLIKRIIIDLDYPFIDYKWDEFIEFLKHISSLSLKDIYYSVFNEYYYFYLIGKYDFKKYTKCIYRLLNIKERFENIYEKIINYYENVLIINKDKIYEFINFCKSKNIKFTFVLNAGQIHYNKFIRSMPEFKNIDILIPSCKSNTTPSEYLFYHNLNKIFNISDNFEKILFIDNNIDNLITAKEMGFITLFFDPETDLCKLISNYVLNF